MNHWLIETALEATAPEQREAVYRRMHAVADKAFEVLMPDQHDARRSLVGALPDRPMPLSDHEFAQSLRDEKAQSLRVEKAQTLRVVDDRPAPAEVGRPGSPNLGGAAAGGAPQARRLLPPSAAQLQEAGRPARLDETAPNAPAPHATAVADPVAFYRAQPPRKSPAGRPSTHIQSFRLLDSDQMDAAWRYPLPDEGDADIATPAVGGVSDADSARHQPLEGGSIDRGQRPLPQDDLNPREGSPTSASAATAESSPAAPPNVVPASHATAGRASSDPPNGGIMSPKMSTATECDATEFAAARVLPTLVGSHNAGDGTAGLKSA